MHAACSVPKIILDVPKAENTADNGMGIDLWVDRGIFPPLFEVEGMPSVLYPFFFFGGKHFLYAVFIG